MKICHVVPSLEEQHGGPSKSVRALAAALAGIGNEVSLMATAPDGRGDIRGDSDGVHTAIFARDWPARICPSRGLHAALAAAPVEIVHHHALWLRTLHYAHHAAKRHRAKFIVSPRGAMSTWAWERHAHRKRIAAAFVHPGAFPAVDGWHATSPAEEQEIRARGFNQPVCVAPNGVQPPDPAATAQAVETWRKLCPESTGRRVALFYSRFHSKKRVHELIDLWCQHGPADWLLMLVGIPEEYGTAALQSRVGTTRGIRIFDGAGKPPPFGIASLFLLPSHNENFGLAIGEAMAHGVPVVVTDTTPWRVMAERNLGWCVPWTDFPAAVRAAANMPPEALRDRGAAARRWCLDEFSWEKSARRLHHFYGMLQRTAA